MIKSPEVGANARDAARAYLWQNTKIEVHVANAALPNLSGPMTPRNKHTRLYTFHFYDTNKHPSVIIA